VSTATVELPWIPHRPQRQADIDQRSAV